MKNRVREPCRRQYRGSWACTTPVLPQASSGSVMRTAPVHGERSSACRLGLKMVSRHGPPSARIHSKERQGSAARSRLSSPSWGNVGVNFSAVALGRPPGATSADCPPTGSTTRPFFPFSTTFLSHRRTRFVSSPRSPSNRSHRAQPISTENADQTALSTP